MLRLSDALVNRPIVSLRSGGSLGTALNPIIDPRNFKILGWWVSERGHTEKRILLVEDIRRVTDDGLMVDSEENLVLPGDLVRLKETLAANWTLVGKPVKTKRQKLGKVTDYSYNDGMMVQKLYVSVPIVKMLSSTNTLLIDRSQIVEVTDHYIMVRDAEVTENAEMPAAVPA